MRFKVNEAKISLRQRKEEERKKKEIEAGKEMCRKYPDRYTDLIDAVDFPYKVTDRGTAYKLALTVKRDDEDEDDIVNEVMLDVRTLFKKVNDDDWTYTKKGIRIPLKYAEFLANTLLEIVEDVRAKKISF